MKILVACEYSGRVRDSFINRGHDAISCDLLPTERPGPHYQGDVRHMLDKEWDLIIAHPPCTFLTLAGVRWLYEKPDRWGSPPVRVESRWRDMEDACKFFNMFLDHECKRKVIENPAMHGHAQRLIRKKQDQIIQPWQFGHPENKKTCLWLDGVSPLTPTNDVSAAMKNMTEKEKNKIHHAVPGPDRWKLRSLTFQGIADAMGAQWG